MPTTDAATLRLDDLPRLARPLRLAALGRDMPIRPRPSPPRRVSTRQATPRLNDNPCPAGPERRAEPDPDSPGRYDQPLLATTVRAATTRRDQPSPHDTPFRADPGRLAPSFLTSPLRHDQPSPPSPLLATTTRPAHPRLRRPTNERSN